VGLIFINFYILSSKITILTFSAASLFIPQESTYISGAKIAHRLSFEIACCVMSQPRYMNQHGFDFWTREGNYNP